MSNATVTSLEYCLTSEEYRTKGYEIANSVRAIGTAFGLMYSFATA